MNKQEQEWAGEFGNKYTIRNQPCPIERSLFWDKILDIYQPARILEVGCGDGKNMSFLRDDLRVEVCGIDINITAVKKALEYGVWPTVGSIYDIPFKDGWFDLVFTCGVLIHIPTDSLPTALSEMRRCSRKYVLIMEYYAEKEEEIEYRGRLGLLWKRPFDKIYEQQLPTDRLIDSGFLGKDQGFDDVTWWLWEVDKCLGQ